MARLLHRGCRRIEDQWTCLADVRAGCNIMHAHTQYRVLNGECLFSAGDSVVGLRLLTRQSDTSYLTRVLAGTPPPRMAEPPLHPSFMYRRTGHLMMINLEARDATGPRQSTHLVVHKRQPRVWYQSRHSILCARIHHPLVCNRESCPS